MGPLPKRKLSKGRRNRRRAHDALSIKHLIPCPTCGKYKVAHRVCPSCGSYNGRKVVEIEEEKE